MHNSVILSLDVRSRKVVMCTGIVLLVLGVIGIALPQVMSVTIALFAGWLLIAAGVLSLYSTWHGFRARGLAWLKPFVLIVFGLLILLHPLAGTAALGLVLAIFFLLVGFAGFGSALEMRPQRGWGWIMLNGLMSLALAAVFITGWPFTSVWLIGMFIGISLLFDGISLLMLAVATKPD